MRWEFIFRVLETFGFGENLDKSILFNDNELCTINNGHTSDIKSIKITQLANNLTLFMKDESSAVRALEQTSRFKDSAGLKLNISKTVGMILWEVSIPSRACDIIMTS